MDLTKQFFKYVSQNIFGLLGTSCYILADTYFIAQAAGTDGAKPILDITTKAGRPNIQWSKGKADALEIWVDRSDDKGFALFTIASSPRVPDPTPLPASPTRWKYKAIYRLKDVQIGDWSDVVSVAVGG